MENEEEINLGGRPTDYKEDFNEQAYKLCLLGATDKTLSEFFEVCEATINNWKKEYPKFLESISQGKKFADIEVASSLFKGTQDRIVTEQQAIKLKRVFYKDGKRHEEEVVELVDLEKTIPADFRNQQFWLKNRSPKEWRDTQNIDHTSKGDSINVISLGKGVKPDE